MLEILIFVIGFAVVFVVLLLVIVVVGIRQEPTTQELSERAPSLVATFVRRLLGTYVRRPDSSPSLDQGDKGNASLRTTPLIGPMDKANL